MNTTKIKNANLICIIGSPGTGKTVMAYELKKALKKDLDVLDDYSYKLSYSQKPIYDLMSRVTKLRHTQEQFVVVSHYSRLLNKLWSLFEQPFRSEVKLAVIFTSAEHDSLDNFHFSIPVGLIYKFRKSYRNAITKKTKTRPYLVVTPDNGVRIGRFRDSRTKSQKFGDGIRQ